MGFLSALKGIGKAAIGAIPGVGPALSNVLGAAGDIGSVLGKQQQGAAEGRLAEGQLINSANRNAIDLFDTQQSAQNSAAQTDLSRKKYTDDALGQNASRAVIAALLGGGGLESNVKMPGRISMPSFSGGPLAALKANPEALAALASLGRQSGEKLNTAPSFEGGSLLAAPSLQGLPQAGKSSGFLSTLANIGQLAGAASPYIKPKAPATTPPFVDPAVVANMGKATSKVRFG